VPDQSSSPKHSNNPFQSEVQIILPSASVVSQNLAAPPNDFDEALLAPCPPVESLNEMFVAAFNPRAYKGKKDSLISPLELPFEQQVDLARIHFLLQQKIELEEGDVYVRQGPLVDTSATRGYRVTWLACEGRQSCYLPSIDVLSHILEYEEWNLPTFSSERFSPGTARVQCYLASDPTVSSWLGIAVTLEGFVECIEHFEASAHKYGKAREPSIIRDLIDYQLRQRAVGGREDGLKDPDAVSPDEYREQRAALFHERSYITFFMPSDRQTIPGGYYSCGISYHLADSESADALGAALFRQRLTVSRDSEGVLQVLLQPWA